MSGMVPTRAGFVSLWFASLCGGVSAQAAEPVTLDASRHYVLGASMVSSADHLGQSDQRLRLRPLWAFQLGRFRFSTARASRLLSLGRETVDPGVSTVLTGSERWSLSTSLQIDGARSWDQDPMLRGLPDVRATLRGRASARVALGPHLNWSLSGSQDLLGRGGGFRLNTGLSYHYPVSGQTYWDLSLGTGWGNALYRQTHYGISPEAALATGRPAYGLGAGWDSVSLGWGMTSALNRRWVAFGGLNAAQLQGAAARSPLVGRVTTYSAMLGLAYRNH